MFGWEMIPSLLWFSVFLLLSEYYVTETHEMLNLLKMSYPSSIIINLIMCSWFRGQQFLMYFCQKPDWPSPINNQQKSESRRQWFSS